MVKLRHLALAFVVVVSTCACSTESAPSPTPAPSSSLPPEVAQARELAQDYLEALVGSLPCSKVWALVDPSGDDQASFCAALRDYRTEVRAVTLGQVTDATEDYTIFAVRVDYRDGSPPVLDSEIEIDVVDGKPLVAAGLP